MARIVINPPVPLNHGPPLVDDVWFGDAWSTVINKMNSMTSDIYSGLPLTYTISPGQVTYANIQNVSASKILGNPTGSPAAPSEIPLGGTLTFVGGALQTIGGSGDVTWSANSFTNAISANAVTNAKSAQMAANTIKGNNTGGLSNPIDLTIAQLNAMGIGSGIIDGTTTIASGVSTSVLNNTGGVVGHYTVPFGVTLGGTGAATLTANSVLLGEGTGPVGFASIGTAGRLLIDQGAAVDPAFRAMSGDAAITSAGAITIGANVISNAKFRQGSGLSLVGVTGSATANVADIIGTANQIPIVNSGGTALTFATVSGDLTNVFNTFTISAAAVTYAKMQNVTASRLLGNPTGGAAAPSEITLGAALTFSGSALQTVAFAGDVTTPANSITTTISANAVTNAKFRQSAGLSLVGVTGSATANVADIVGAANQIPIVNSGATALAFVTVSGDLTNSFGAFTIAAGAVTNAKLAAGAAAANVGSVGGDLTGTLPNPTIAALAVTNAKMASGAASANVGTVGGDLTGTLPNPTIATNAVTNAKAAQMVANTIKGNNTGSTANAADLTVAQVQTMIGTGAMVLLNTLTASNVALLSDTSSFGGAYTDFFIHIENMVPVTNAAVFEVFVHSGGVFQNTNYLNTSSFLDLFFSAGIDNTAGKGISARIWTGNLSSTTTRKLIMSTYLLVNGGSVNSQSSGAFWNGGNGAIDGFQFQFSAGNISTGTIKIYGIT